MIRPPRICILTPGALGSNPRVVKEANALQAAGYAVTVVSTRTLDAVDARDQDVLANASWRSVRLDFRHRRQRRIPRAVQMASTAATRLVGATAALAAGGLSQYTMALTAAATRIPAELYIAHYPAALAAAATAARKNGGGFSYDAEDFYPGETFGSASRLLRAVEQRRLKDCRYMTAASPGIADAYVEEYGIPRPTVLLNVFPRSEGPKHCTSSGSVSPGPSVYWFSQTVGPDRGLECSVRALALARTKPHLYMRGKPSDGFVDVLTDIAREAGVVDQIHFLASAPPSDMVRLAADYDIGLVGETGHNRNRQIALTNKQFTYLLAGIPSLLSDISSHRAFADDVGDAARLYITEDPASLADGIDELLEDPASLAQARASAFALGQSRFNWDQEQAGLLTLVAKALS